MPMHDWTRVDAGIFHDFHHTWIAEIKRSLNAGLLPPSYYALAEQITGEFGPDVLALKAPTGNGQPLGEDRGVALLTAAVPRVRFRIPADDDPYVAKAKVIRIRHVSDHSVVAVIEIVSSGNKASKNNFDLFVNKAGQLIQAGVHLLVIDPYPPGPRDPEGIHPPIWAEVTIKRGDFHLPEGLNLTLASYKAGPIREAFIEPTAVGRPLADMPVFLTGEHYVSVPLEATYEAAWQTVPAYWKKVLAGPHAE